MARVIKAEACGLLWQGWRTLGNSGDKMWDVRWGVGWAWHRGWGLTLDPTAWRPSRATLVCCIGRGGRKCPWVVLLGTGPGEVTCWAQGTVRGRDVCPPSAQSPSLSRSPVTHPGVQCPPLIHSAVASLPLRAEGQYWQEITSLGPQDSRGLQGIAPPST